jgi:hypothetical protein
MMSKNAGGMYISSSFMIVTISSCSLPSFFMLIDFQVMTSKKWQSPVSVWRTCGSIIPWIAIGSICIIMTWQSWDFIPLKIFLFGSRYLLMSPM